MPTFIYLRHVRLTTGSQKHESYELCCINYFKFSEKENAALLEMSTNAVVFPPSQLACFIASVSCFNLNTSKLIPHLTVTFITPDIGKDDLPQAFSTLPEVFRNCPVRRFLHF